MKILLLQELINKRYLLNKNFQKLADLRVLKVFGLTTMLAGSTIAQEPGSLARKESFAELWKNEPFGSQDLSREIINKRDAFSKHFLNDNGNITAHIASGEINYLENGQWLTIYHTISPNANGFENVHNSHKTYYPAFSTGSLKTVLKNGEVIRDMMNMNLHFRVNGEKAQVKTIQNKKGNAAFNQLTYQNAYGNGIDLQLTQETSIRKMDYLIQDIEAIGNIPGNATHLVFEETVELPDGWTAELKNNLIFLKDSKGIVQAFYEKPFLEDAPDFGKTARINNTGKSLKEVGEYTIEQNGKLLTIQTAVTIAWITAAERQFPLKIDPTLNVTPNNASNWTGNIWSDGEYENLGINMGRAFGYWVRGAMRFNVSSIPSGSTVNAATGYINILAGYSAPAARTWAFTNSSDPLGVPVGVNSSSAALYNSMTTVLSASTTIYSLGWRSSLFSAGGATYLQNSFVNGFFSIGLCSTGTYNNGQYIDVAPYTSANKPYVNIDYTTVPMVCATLTNLASSIGSPANGLAHHLSLSWNTITGATGYDVEYSTDGSNFSSASPASVTTNSYDFNAGDNPNARYWFRVRAKDGSQTCNWTNTTPIYTVADLPSIPLLTNAVGNSLDLTLQAETPVANPAITTYSIVCSTTSQFVQADGTLGAAEVFRTKADWGTVHITGLSTSTQYCFYARAKNGDGHVVSGETNISGTETFAANTNFSALGAAPNNKWWTPPTPTSGSPMVYSASGSNCSDGYVGFSGSSNNFFGSFLRSPQQNCTGLTEVTVTFDLSNSYFAANPLDRIYFNMWAPTTSAPTGTYINATSVEGVATNTLYFSEVRSCKRITVKFDLSTVSNKSAILFYLNVNCGYNNSNVFSFKLDNISILEKAPTACITTSNAPTPVFHNLGGSQQIIFDNARYDSDKPIFRVSHYGSVAATSYQIEMNTKDDFTGTSIVQTFTGTYAAQTPANFLFSNAEGQLVNQTTYYVRARINTGAGYGFWSTKLHSYTYDTGKTTPSWFQTTTPQFATDYLSGTKTLSDFTTVLPASGGGANVFTDPSFETGQNWSVKTSYAIYETYLTSNSNATNGITNGTNCVKFAEDDYSWQYFLDGEYSNVSQQVDLTGVGEIKFDLTHWRNTQNTTYSCGIGRACKIVWSFKVIIGNAGTANDNSGTEVYTWTPTTAEFGVTNKLNETIDLSALGLTGVKTVKFSRVVTNGGGSWYDDDKYYLDNVRTGAGSLQTSGTIISTPVRLASVQGATGYKELVWNQELAGGSINFDLQRYNTGSSLWENVTGFSAIQDATSNGEKSFDLENAGFPAADSIRIVGRLTGSTSALKLNDWAIFFTYPQAPLPVTLTSFTARCERAVELSWSTSSEQNSDSFILEKSRNLTDWIFVANQAAAGNSSVNITYTESDQDPWKEVAYYRLRQLDFNGQEKVYGPISVSCNENENSMTVYPNPNQGDFTIEISSTVNMRDVQLYLTDLTGKIITSRTLDIEAGTTQLFMNDLDLQMGTYFIQFHENENQLKPVKVVVNR